MIAKKLIPIKVFTLLLFVSILVVIGLRGHEYPKLEPKVLAQSTQNMPNDALLQSALNISRMSMNPVWKAQSLTQIAQTYSKYGYHEKSLSIFEEALRNLNESPETIYTRVQRAKVLADFAKVLADMGNRDRALELLEQALFEVEHSEYRFSVNESTDLAHLSMSFIISGELQKGLLLLSQARKVADRITRLDNKANALLEVAEGYILEQQTKSAFIVIEDALDAIKQLDEDESVEKSRLLVEVLGKCSSLSDKESTQILALAAQIAEGIPNPLLSAEPIIAAAQVHLKAGREAYAFDMLNKAYTASQKPRHRFIWSRPRAMTRVAVAYLEAGQNQKALLIVQKAHNALQTDALSGSEKAETLAEISVIYDGVNQKDRATALLDEATSVIKSSRMWTYNKAQTLAEIAEKRANHGELQLCRELLLSSLEESLKTPADAGAQARHLAGIGRRFVQLCGSDLTLDIFNRAIDVESKGQLTRETRTATIASKIASFAAIASKITQKCDRYMNAVAISVLMDDPGTSSEFLFDMAVLSMDLECELGAKGTKEGMP